MNSTVSSDFVQGGIQANGVQMQHILNALCREYLLKNPQPQCAMYAHSYNSNVQTQTRRFSVPEMQMAQLAQMATMQQYAPIPHIAMPSQFSGLQPERTHQILQILPREGAPGHNFSQMQAYQMQRTHGLIPAKLGEQAMQYQQDGQIPTQFSTDRLSSVKKDMQQRACHSASGSIDMGTTSANTSFSGTYISGGYQCATPPSEWIAQSTYAPLIPQHSQFSKTYIANEAPMKSTLYSNGPQVIPEKSMGVLSKSPTDEYPLYFAQCQPQGYQDVNKQKHIVELLKILSQTREDTDVIIKAYPKRLLSSQKGDTFRGSKFRGVSKNGNQWQILIMVNKKKRYIGTIASEEEAARCYDKAAIQNHGIKAKTNYDYTREEICDILNERPLVKE